jgi:two-component sensor histidine kinase
MINALAVLIVLLFAEIFRLAVVRAVAERDREIEHRKMLHAELDHRTKNNFALVASLLELQRRREDDPKVASALDQAISRVHSFAGAYANLSDRSGEGTDVAMNTYLTDVVERIADAAFKDGVKVRVMADPCVLPRETAVAIGLFTNEALTNCAKYAFPGDRAGGVEVLFRCEGENWDLIVRDDGIGDAGPSLSGLGMRLFEAFAKQAGGHYACETSETGRVVSLVSAASD